MIEYLLGILIYKLTEVSIMKLYKHNFDLSYIIKFYGLSESDWKLLPAISKKLYIDLFNGMVHPKLNNVEYIIIELI